jgi:gluconokinase
VSTTLVVGGVSGAGKTTVAGLVGAALGWPVADADDFHPPRNVALMRSGHPLTDADRAPWLDALAAWVGGCEAVGQDAVLACSMLHRRYRDRLAVGHPSVLFVQLVVPEAELLDRLQHRRGHWMPASLLGSQLDALDPLEPDEPGLQVDGSGLPGEVAALVVAAVRGRLDGTAPARGGAPEGPQVDR